MWGSGRKIFNCVDLHCGGEPARVVLSGVGDTPGKTMAEKRIYFMEHMDDVRKVLLLEPRGYPCQNVNFLLPSSHPDADLGYIIAEQQKIYPLFSGHNTICVVTAVLETGLVKMEEPITLLKLEAPGGIISIRAECDGGRVIRVEMESMPSFLGLSDVNVEVPELGQVKLDIAFGGMWYAIVQAEDLGLELTPSNGKKLVKFGEMIKVAAREQHPVQHPHLQYPGPDILVFTGPPVREGTLVKATNTVVMSNGALDWHNPDTFTAMLDRSPCGSGTAAVMSSLHARGILKEDDTFVHAGILGTVMEGKILSKTMITEDQSGILPIISGRAFITSTSQQIVEQDDPLPLGFSVSDIWS